MRLKTVTFYDFHVVRPSQCLILIRQFKIPKVKSMCVHLKYDFVSLCCQDELWTK